MKKYFLFAVLGSLFLASCAQKEEKREEFKEEHNKDFKRNNGVPEAAIMDSAQVKDSVNVETK